MEGPKYPGTNPMPYAVYVDKQDNVWLSDFAANTLVRFDPIQETFKVFSLPSPEANVRQILGRPGEEKLVVIRTDNRIISESAKIENSSM
jgi:virginiamycin B lyase